MIVPDYKCAHCGGDIAMKRLVYVHEVRGAHWKGIVMLRCAACDRAYEKPISMRVLEESDNAKH